MSALVQDLAAHGVRWDLSALFSGLDDPRIQEAWRTAHQRADTFAGQYRGRVAEGTLAPAGLAQAIRELELLHNDAEKPIDYAYLRFAADTSDPETGAFLQAQMEEASAVKVKLMFFELELQDAPDAYVEAALADAAMADYRHWLTVLRQFRPYKLSETEEVLLEEVANVGTRAWVRLHEELTSNAVYVFVAPGSGEAEELSQEEVMDKLRDPDRQVRQAAADALSEGMQALERTIVFTYNTLLADKKLDDRLRGHEYPEHRRHLTNELDRATVDLVMDLCSEHQGLVARYYRVKREILGVAELTHVDRYAPLFPSKQKMDWSAGRDLVLDAFASFSGEMRDRAAEFFERNWIDAEPRDGKSGGAFCASNTVDTHPVVLMTYLGDLHDVGTLAHELGHGVHASLARRQTPFNASGTLPLAELASIFAEQIVFERLVGGADLRDRLSLYAEKIEGTFATVFRQAAMFRFERRCHEHRRAEGELSPETFGDFWQEEQQSMFGDSMVLGEQHRRWWQYVGHFFFAPFYVYAYSFGELLSLAVYAKAKHEGPTFADRYLEVLSLGGSRSPDELMSILGVDLRSREFWEGGLAAIEAMTVEFESLWAQAKAQGLEAAR